MPVIINYSLFLISIDLKSTFVNTVHSCKYMNSYVKETYEVPDTAAPPTIEPNMESTCPTTPVQKPTVEAGIPLSIRNIGSMFKAPCSPVNNENICWYGEA